jgi:hypothetical protein
MAATAATPGLTPAEVHRYEAEGYLIVRGVFSTFQMAAVAEEAEHLLRRRDLIATDNLRCRWQDHVETKECLFDAFDPVIDLGRACAQVAQDPRLVSRVAALYGEEACLFKDKLIFKPPGAAGYALHQDYIAWPSFPRSFLTAVVAVDPADRGNGCTEVFAGGHRDGYLSPADGLYHPIPEGVVDETRAVPLELEPGDVAFFGSFMPHRSAPNRSGGWRRQLYLSYNAVSDGGPQREQHYREFHAWLRERYAEYGRTNVSFR